MGRTIVLTDEQRREIETLAALLTREQIADYFGIGRTTFGQILKRDEEAAVRYKRGKAKAIAHVANGLLQKARGGDTTSSIFFLKTQAGWRETSRIEHADEGRASLAELLRRIEDEPGIGGGPATGVSDGRDTARLAPPREESGHAESVEED